MDQEEFRKLLSSSAGYSRDSHKQVAKPASHTSAFQPRKLSQKKQKSTFKDKDGGGRAGVESNYDPTDTLLEDANSRDIVLKDSHITRKEEMANVGNNTGLLGETKGLDFALLEQTKSLLDTEEDDASLEAAFHASHARSEVPTGRKRTREDLIRALKEQRTDPNNVNSSVSEIDLFQKAKQQGKFKPIGAPDAPTMKKERIRTKGNERPKRKKQKIANIEEGGSQSQARKLSREPEKELAHDSSSISAPPPPIDVDIDIFADAGEYQGLVLDEEGSDEDATSNKEDTHLNVDSHPSNNWFKADEPEALFKVGASSLQPLDSATAPASPSSPRPSSPSKEGALEEGSTVPARLESLASSSLPSIRDFLDIDKATEAYEKRQARKKKKGDKKEKGSTEDKIHRDYQKLNSYIKGKES